MANLKFDFLHSYETGERRESEPASAYQYDEGHVLEAVLPSAVTSCEIHYWIRGQEKSEAYTPGSITQNQDGSCTVIGNIPNLYFETNGELRVYIVVTDGDASITTYEGYVHVCQRSMPDDYVDDDPENEATRILTEATAAAATATAAAQTAQDVADSIPADYSTLSDDVEEIKDGFTQLEYDVYYESEEILANKSVITASGVKVDAGNSRVTVSIANGSSFRFRTSGTSLINKYALYYNEGGSSQRFGTNLLPNTNYEFTAVTDVTSLYIYTGASDVIGTGTIQLFVTEVAYNNNSIEKQILDIESDVEILQPLSGNNWELDKNAFTTICVHHDNFSRTMTGYEIGMNAGGTDTGNAYDWVTPSTYDDGLRVDNGATFNADSTRTYTFSLRKLAEAHAENFMFESNVPVNGSPVLFGMNVTDIGNFLYFEFRKNTAGYRCICKLVKNGSFSGDKFDVQLGSIVAKVLSVYCIRGIMYVYFDDTFGFSAEIGDFGDYLYLCSTKSYNTHFDFVNVFNVVSKTSWNPNRVLDSGVSDIPLKTVSANEGNYELQNAVAHWSNYADHMTLHSDDPLIHSGRRCEISVGNMNDFNGNLRHFAISFDVLFPSEYIDTEQGDLFVQTHDRDGTYRGTVPFALYIKNNVINVNTSSTYEPKADNTTVIIDLHRFDFAEVELGKWHHFEIEIKERYEERQNPFLRIKIDGKTEFEYRKANCYNDLLGTSPQYGIYKNNWGTGVTEFQRYFDNFRIDYM